MRELASLGWTKSCIDGALFLKWDGKCFPGILMAHVDDMVMGGNFAARKRFEELGKRLEFGSLQENSFFREASYST